MFKMVYTTHKNGDDLGMVYCFTVYSNHRSESRQVETILVWFDMLWPTMAAKTIMNHHQVGLFYGATWTSWPDTRWQVIQ